MECFGAVSGHSFSPKILGLNARIFRTVFGQSGTDFRTCVLFLRVVAKK